ncbi:MAG: GNAT family N-acetyltransferase [Clostridia bacterium]|nr:GNAT family N-acetyltransferase [Clostridia bacterium]
MHTVLYTPRLILRPWQESDAADLYRYASDPAVGPAAGWPPHTDEDDSRAVIRDVLMIPGTFAVCRREDGAAIGSVGLKTGDNTDMTDREDECELGYWIGRPYWGQGLIPEAVGEILRHAFEDLGMRAVWCGYYDGNEKSRRVQEKCGFTYHHTTEGLEVPLLGEIRTGHVSRLTREDWLQR